LVTGQTYLLQALHSKYRKARGTKEVTYFGQLSWESQELEYKRGWRRFRLPKFHPNFRLRNMFENNKKKYSYALQILCYGWETWHV